MSSDLSWLELEVGWVSVSAGLEVNLGFEVRAAALSRWTTRWFNLLRKS